MSGFILAEGEAAARFQGENKSMSIKVPKDGLTPQGENAFSPGQMAALFGYAKKMILRAAAQMSEGELSLNPIGEGEEIPCRHCDYHAICGFDRQYRGNEMRPKERIEKERFFLEIGGDDGGNEAD